MQASRKGATKVEDDLDWDPVEPPAESGGGKEGQAAKEAESFANSFMDYVEVKEGSDGGDKPSKGPKEEVSPSEVSASFCFQITSSQIHQDLRRWTVLLRDYSGERDAQDGGRQESATNQV